MTKITFSVVFIIALLLAAYSFNSYLPFLIQQTKALGWIGFLFFIILYVLAALLFLPTMIMTLAGGALYGPVTGTLLNLTGATLGAGISFYISRYLANNWFTAQRGPRLDKMLSGVEKRGWQFVAFLRLLPVVPFNLVNYGMGLTRMNGGQFLLITLIFLIPGEIVYTYCGFLGMNTLLNPSAIPYETIGYLALIAGLIILIGLRIKSRLG